MMGKGFSTSSTDENFREMEPNSGSISALKDADSSPPTQGLPDGLDTGLAGPLFARSVAEGVLYVPGDLAFADEPGPVPTRHARLSFGVADEAQIAEGVRRLAAAVAGCLQSVS